MTRRPDVVSIVESVYRTELDDSAWLGGICAGTDAVAGSGLGTCGWFLDARDLGAVRMYGLEGSHLRCPLDLSLATSAAQPADFEAYFVRQAVGTGSGQLGLEG